MKNCVEQFARNYAKSYENLLEICRKNAKNTDYLMKNEFLKSYEDFYGDSILANFITENYFAIQNMNKISFIELNRIFG